MRFLHQVLGPTLRWLVAPVAALSSLLKFRTALQPENLALRHPVGVLQRSAKKRPRLTVLDRFFWARLCRVWRDWRSALVIVKPETVIAWRRKGFRVFRTWKVRRGQAGRPPVSRATRELIRKMSREIPLWGAPGIHGELLKLGIGVGGTSAGKYMVRHRNAHPTAEWMAQQLRDAVPWDSAPRCLSRDRDRVFGDDFVEQVKAMGIEEVLSKLGRYGRHSHRKWGEWWQSPWSAGSIIDTSGGQPESSRRDCSPPGRSVPRDLLPSAPSRRPAPINGRKEAAAWRIRPLCARAAGPRPRSASWRPAFGRVPVPTGITICADIRLRKRMATSASGVMPSALARTGNRAHRAPATCGRAASVTGTRTRPQGVSRGVAGHGSRFKRRKRMRMPLSQ